MSLPEDIKEAVQCAIDTIREQALHQQKNNTWFLAIGLVLVLGVSTMVALWTDRIVKDYPWLADKASVMHRIDQNSAQLSEIKSILIGIQAMLTLESRLDATERKVGELEQHLNGTP